MTVHNDEPVEARLKPSTTLEPSTARGLAARLLTHLPSEEVKSVAGSGDGELAVMIDLFSPSPRIVGVFVEPPGSESSPSCGGDSGYKPVSCQTEPVLVEVLARAGDNPRMPVLMGRYHDDARGSILVQVWGSHGGGASRDLVHELLADPFLGIQTSVSLNEEGARLVNFEELKIELRTKAL